MKITLYLLQLETKKYYIGQTDDVLTRFSEHKLGQGSKWTRKYPPLKILKTKQITINNVGQSMLYENWMTLHYMEKFGWRNVRGGNFLDLEDYRLSSKLEPIYDIKSDVIKYFVKSPYLFGVSEKWIIYVLLLENEKFYIGSTKHLGKSLSKHFSQKGINWTRINKPIKVIEFHVLEENTESYLAVKKGKYKNYSSKYGESNVLGGNS